VATTIGGRGCAPVASGTTTTVRRARLSASAVTTTAGRIGRISPLSTASKSTHQMSPRRTASPAAGGAAIIRSAR
jgi:hypothetical protein